MFAGLLRFKICGHPALLWGCTSGLMQYSSMVLISWYTCRSFTNVMEPKLQTNSRVLRWLWSSCTKILVQGSQARVCETKVEGDQASFLQNYIKIYCFHPFSIQRLLFELYFTKAFIFVILSQKIFYFLFFQCFHPFSTLRSCLS